MVSYTQKQFFTGSPTEKLCMYICEKLTVMLIECTVLGSMAIRSPHSSLAGELNTTYKSKFIVRTACPNMTVVHCFLPIERCMPLPCNLTEVSVFRGSKRKYCQYRSWTSDYLSFRIDSFNQKWSTKRLQGSSLLPFSMIHNGRLMSWCWETGDCNTSTLLSSTWLAYSTKMAGIDIETEEALRSPWALGL